MRKGLTIKSEMFGHHDDETIAFHVTDETPKFELPHTTIYFSAKNIDLVIDSMLDAKIGYEKQKGTTNDD